MWPLFRVKEIADMVQHLDEGDVRLESITEYQDFSNVCLCRAVLTVSLYSHRHRYEILLM